MVVLRFMLTVSLRLFTMYEFTNMLIHIWATHIFYHANYTYVPIVPTTVQHVGNKK